MSKEKKIDTISIDFSTKTTEPCPKSMREIIDDLFHLISAAHELQTDLIRLQGVVLYAKEKKMIDMLSFSKEAINDFCYLVKMINDHKYLFTSSAVAFGNKEDLELLKQRVAEAEKEEVGH